jgi:hypothetical protein
MGLSQSKTEPFALNPLRPMRPPISGDEGLQALFRAEQIDQYQQRVKESPINIKARVGQTYMPTPFSIKRGVPPANPRDPWPNGQVIWMSESADAGLPHTRAPNYICMSIAFPEAQLASTLLHERIHISQRLHPKAWVDLMADAWAMKPWYGDIPDKLRKALRVNPDLVNAPTFIWKDRFVPMGIFKDEQRPKLADIQVVWWDVKGRVILYEPPPGWKEFFGDVPAGEHPYEIAAYLLTARNANNKAFNALTPRLSKLPRQEV